LTGRGWRRWLPSALVSRGRHAEPIGRLAFLHLPRTGGTAVQHHLEAIVGKGNVLRLRLPPDYLERLDAIRSSQIVLGHFFYPVVRLMPDAKLATVIREPVERSISVWEYLHWQTQHPDHERLRSRGIQSLDEFAEDEALAAHVRDNQTRLLGVEYDVEAIVSALEAKEMDLVEAQRIAATAEGAPADAATLGRAKRRLDQMEVVGVTEDLPGFAHRLEAATGLASGREPKRDNATPPGTLAMRSEAYGESTRRRLAELNAYDAELYSFARRLSESKPHARMGSHSALPR
jgi:hypothetical protein